MNNIKNHLPIFTLTERSKRINSWEKNKAIVDLYVKSSIAEGPSYFKTLQQVGATFGLTRQRIDQIITKMQVRIMTPDGWEIAKVVGDAFLYDKLSPSDIVKRVAEHKLARKNVNLALSETQIAHMIPRLVGSKKQTRQQWIDEKLNANEEGGSIA